MKATYERLEQMEARISEDGFTNPKGIGSDIPHFVFDYPSEDELQVRLYVRNMLKRTHVNIVEVNLFDFLLSFFEGEVNELIEVSEEEGLPELLDVFDSVLTDEDVVVDQFLEKTEGADLVFITGVGTAHPFLRSSQLLKSLSNKGFRKPILVFYPGYFTGLRLKMFGIFDNEDDYRLSRIS